MEIQYMEESCVEICKLENEYVEINKLEICKFCEKRCRSLYPFDPVCLTIPKRGGPPPLFESTPIIPANETSSLFNRFS
jgi:hypothetical protein